MPKVSHIKIIADALEQEIRRYGRIPNGQIAQTD